MNGRAYYEKEFERELLIKKLNKIFESMKNILVTGGAGFIGTNLIKNLLKDNYDITSLIIILLD